MTVKAETDRFIEKLLEASKRKKWSNRFRASSLPACQLKHLWFAFDEKLDEQPGERRGFFNDFFMDLGTAIHTTTQRWLGRLGVLFGDWACENFDCEHFHDRDDDGEVIPVIRARFGPQKCSNCRHQLIYSEFKFSGKPGGHCDGLIKLGELTPEDDDFAVLEIKSAGEKAIARFKEQGLPYSYEMQASEYTFRLRELGYNIVGVMFLIIPRDNPRGMLAMWVQPKRVKTVHASIVRDHEACVATLETGDFSEIKPQCAKPADANGCPYEANCFAPISGKLFIEKADRFYGDERPVKLPMFPEID